MSSEWRKEATDNLEMGASTMNLLDDAPMIEMDLNESESILGSSNYNLRPEFEGDAAGIGVNSLYYGVFVGAIEGVGLSGMSVMAIVETRLECGMLLCGKQN